MNAEVEKMTDEEVSEEMSKIINMISDLENKIDDESVSKKDFDLLLKRMKIVGAELKVRAKK